MQKSLILAAPSSGAGKTTVTLALLRLLAREGVAVRGAKSGPDYIDPKFHEAACGQPCLNLDAWAMAPDRLKGLAAGGGAAGSDRRLNGTSVKSFKLTRKKLQSFARARRRPPPRSEPCKRARAPVSTLYPRTSPPSCSRTSGTTRETASRSPR